MRTSEQVVDEAVTLLDASAGIAFGPSAACLWQHEAPSTHHLHIPNDRDGLTQETLLQRVVMTALLNQWEVTILDLHDTYGWTDGLPRAKRFTDHSLAIAEVWMLTEDHCLISQRPSAVVIPDYEPIAIGGNAPGHLTLKDDVAAGPGVPHIILGSGVPATPTPGWHTVRKEP